MSSFKFDTSKLVQGIAEREIKTRAALNLYANVVSKKMETHAKTNFPWTPRSGSAHQSLFAGPVQWRGNVIRCTLSHGVDYGVYLEFAHEKRYAIIKPTIDYIAPSAIKGLQNIMK